MSTLGISICLIVLLVGLRLPARYLPAAALALYAVVCTKLTFALGMRAIYPEMILVAVWAWRRGLRFNLPGRPSIVVTCVAAVGLIYYGLVVFIFTGGGANQMVWATSFAFGFILPLFVRAESEDLRSFADCWAILAAIFGLFCTLESLLGQLFLFDSLYNYFGIPSIQHWSSYRAEGPFGHPIYAGTFLSVGVVCSLGMWSARTRPWLLVAAVCGASGVVATVSRGAFVALGVGLGLILVLASVSRVRRQPIVWLSWSAFLALLTIIVLSGSLLERFDSNDAESSDAARSGVYAAASQTVRDHNGFGSGLGLSNESIERYNPQGFPLESSYWQLMVGLGAIGVALIVVILISASVSSLRGQSRLYAAPMLLTLVLGVCTFNAIDQLRTIHPVLGLAIATCLYPNNVDQVHRGRLVAVGSSRLHRIED